jgi:small conductance mechanosensitive channel
MEVLLEQIKSLVAVWGIQVVAAIAILIIGRIVAGTMRKGVAKVLDRANVDVTVAKFLSGFTYVIVMVFTVLAVLAKFGVQTASFVAVLGAAGFAVGFALQGSLANFAAGVLILVLRPFKVGDFIDAAGVAGSVKAIHLFTTELATPDNVQILVPNGKIFGDTIKNFAANDTRRLDMVVGIGYDSSIKTAHALLKEIVGADSRVLQDPEPTIAVAELADSSVNFVVRPWCNRADYWALKFDLTEKIKLVFDENNIEIPFPQRTVHMVQSS